MNQQAEQHYDSDTLWAVHVIGPDELYPMPSGVIALRCVRQLRDDVAISAAKWGIRASLEVCQWPHSAESHSQGIRNALDVMGLSPTLFEASRLTPREEDGTSFHPDMPDGPEETDMTPYFTAMGFELSHVTMEDQITDEDMERYSENPDIGFSFWNPKPPSGEGWLLAGIWDSEEGPHAWYVRPLPEHAERHA